MAPPTLYIPISRWDAASIAGNTLERRVHAAIQLEMRFLTVLYLVDLGIV